MAFSPLTPAVISKLPLGLLGFFGIKNGGQYPQSVIPNIQPTLEQLQILACNYHENITVGIGGITTTGFQGAVVPDPLTIPPSEIWYVSSVTCEPVTFVGDAVVASAVVRSKASNTASNWYRAISPEYTTGASQFRNLPGTFENGNQWFYPGDEFGAWIVSFTNASGDATFGLQLEVTRFPF